MTIHAAPGADGGDGAASPPAPPTSPAGKQGKRDPADCGGPVGEGGTGPTLLSGGAGGTAWDNINPFTGHQGAGDLGFGISGGQGGLNPEDSGYTGDPGHNGNAGAGGSAALNFSANLYHAMAGSRGTPGIRAAGGGGGAGSKANFCLPGSGGGAGGLAGDGGAGGPGGSGAGGASVGVLAIDARAVVAPDTAFTLGAGGAGGILGYSGKPGVASKTAQVTTAGGSVPAIGDFDGDGLDDASDACPIAAGTGNGCPRQRAPAVRRTAARPRRRAPIPACRAAPPPARETTAGTGTLTVRVLPVLRCLDRRVFRIRIKPRKRTSRRRASRSTANA